MEPAPGVYMAGLRMRRRRLASLSNLGRAKHREEAGHGIPDVLQAIRLEKKTEIIPVKVQYSLKLYLQEHETSVSRFCREAILEKLRRQSRA